MEAAGPAIGLPGLLDVLFKTGINGYEAITRVRNADGDFSDHIREIRVEHQVFVDWRTGTQPILEKITPLPQHQERLRLIVATLLQIVAVFHELAELHDGLTHQTSGNTPEKTPESTRSPSPSSAVHFQPAEVAEEIKRAMGLDKLEPLTKDMQRSVSTLSSFKWACLDRKKAQKLYLKLKKYNEDLRRISKPLDETSNHDNSPPGQLFIVPIPRDSNFVSRGDTFRLLDGLLHSNDGRQTRAALWGLSGTGKTSIAVEYCHVLGGPGSPAKSIDIFWVHGNTDASFKAGYQEIAKAANIPITGQDDDNDLNSVKRWLEDSNARDWFMVIDNVDDLSLNPKYIPMVNGRILFTSRDGRIAGHPDFGVATGCGIELQSMARSEAETLLKNNTGISHGAAAGPSDELCEVLGDLPLAITQAAAYIRNTRISIDRYLELFRKSADIQEKLLKEPITPHSTNESNLRTVMTTWTVTLEKIACNDPMAIEILRFMSLLDPEHIPQQLLRAADQFEHVDELDLAKSIGILCNFALITQLDTENYRLHQLVSLFTARSTLEDQNSVLVEAVSHALLKCLPKDKLAEMSKCLHLVPHILAVLHHMEQHTDTDPTALSLQAQLGGIMHVNGQYDAAFKWYQRVLEGQEKPLGKDHEDTLHTVHNIAVLFDRQRQHDTALKWYERALEGREKVLGGDHPDTLSTIHRMALLLSGQGKYDVALKWSERALEGREKALGKDHPETLETVQNTGNIFLYQAQYGVALRWFERALEGREKALGRDHPDTLRTVHSLAILLDKQGQYEVALKWCERALEGREKALGKIHPDVLATVQHMGSIFLQQAQYDVALKWYERALEGQEKAPGKNHPDTLDTVHCISVLFRIQEKHDVALKWCERALERREKVLGRDHPGTLKTVQNTGNIYLQQEQYDIALKWFERALEGREKAMGSDHPDTLDTVYSMALLLGRQGQYEVALKWFERALEGLEKALGRDHPNTLGIVHNMAVMFHHQEQYEVALKFYERALAGQEKALGKNHPETILTSNNMEICAKST